jgi:ribulose kinase
MAIVMGVDFGTLSVRVTLGWNLQSTPEDELFSAL